MQSQAMQAWNISRTKMLKTKNTGLRETNSNRCASQRKQHTFHQTLPQNSYTICANRTANSHFVMPLARAREQQIRHVGARDQKHTTHCQREKPNQRSGFFSGMPGEWISFRCD